MNDLDEVQPQYLKRLRRSLRTRFIRLICFHDYEPYKSRDIGTMSITFYRCKLCGKENCR